MDELNKRIIDLMDSLGYNKSAFAQKVGASLPIITHISTGRNKPGLDIIQKIISTFENVNPYWLLLGQEPMFKEAEKPQIDIQEIKYKLASFQAQLSQPKQTLRTMLEYHKILIDEVLHLQELTKMLQASEQGLLKLDADLKTAKSDIDAKI